MSTATVDSEGRQMIGSILRQARMRHGHDIETMANLLRIRQPFLEAIEQGRYELLPGPTYASGFVRAYAEQLGLDGAEFARRYREETAANPQGVELQLPSPVADSGKPTGRMIAIGLIGLVLAYGTWNLYDDRSLSVSEWIPPIPDQLAGLLPTTPPEIETRVDTAGGNGAVTGPLPPPSPTPAEGDDPAGAPAIEAGPQHEDGAAAPPRDPVVAVTDGADTPLDPSPATPADGAATPGDPPPDVDAEPAPVPEGADAAGPPPAVGNGEAETGVEPAAGTVTDPAAGIDAARVFGDATDARIVLRATQDSWIEVRDPARDDLLLARLMRPGDVYLVPDRPGLTLLTGNAGGLNVYVDGSLTPPLGKDGVVRRNIDLDAEALRGEAPPR